MSMSSEERYKGIGFAVLAGIIFGTAGIFTKSITGFSPLGISAIRLLIGVLFAGSLLWKQENFPEFKQSLKHYPLVFVLGVISSVHFLLFVLAVQKTFIANALILVNTAPILVLLLAPVLLREPITAADVVSVVVTFIGAGLIVGFDRLNLSVEHVLGDLCALGSAFSYALYVMLARNLRKIYSAPTIMCWFFGLGALFLFLGAAMAGIPLYDAPPLQSWIFILLLGLLPTSVGHVSYNLSLKYIQAAKASTIVLLEPVTGAVWAYLFLQEVPPLMALIGILIALGGIALASMTHLSTRN